jgi:glycosyltransferase involved in cell wall biosynthesis
LFREQERMNRPPGVRRIKVALARRVYWRKYVRVLKSYERAHRIIALSHSSKRDFLAHVDDQRASSITVVHLGVVRQAPATAEPSREILPITERPFLLYVGGIDFRKNITGMVRSFYALKPEFPDLQLVVVGKEFTLDAQLADLGWFTTLRENDEFARDVVTPGFVSHDDLLHLYQRAEVFVFPSRYEGFGLPVLEAMQLGCPVVAYANSSIPEVVGDAVPLVEDGGDLAPAVRRVLADPEHRDRLIRDGMAQAATFTWERTAAETLGVLRAAVQGSDPGEVRSLPSSGGPP